MTVDFGRGLKTKFSDYVFDNDLNGRGDGYAVTVDGSNLPVLGAFKPIIKAVYGSSRLGYDADGSQQLHHRQQRRLPLLPWRACRDHPGRHPQAGH